MNRGIYVHIPFCIRKCNYCDFYSSGGACSGEISSYAHAVIKHIELSQDKDLFCDSLYLGGGTPSLLSARDTAGIIDACRKYLGLSDDAEITLEMNPKTADKDSLKAFFASGVNRLSIGVQSLNDNELLKLGRLHDADGAKRTVEDALSAGFGNISCDVMFGIPFQTPHSLLHTLDGLCSYPVTHISAYGLKIEEGTPFYKMNLDVPDEEGERQMYFDIISRLKEHGFEQYEISNFARDSHYSRHNLKYWRGEEYLAFGPSASGYFNGTRYTYKRDIQGYINAVNSLKEPEKDEEYFVDEEEKNREKIIFSLRLTEGINLEECGINPQKLLKNPVISRLIREEYIILGEKLSLTSKGFYISNSVINEILALI